MWMSMAIIQAEGFYLTSEDPKVNQNPLPSTEMAQRTIK